MEEKQKIELEFPIHASSKMIYQYVSTPSGLAEWFADNVNSRGKLVTFIWDDAEEKAIVLSKKNEKYIRYQWLEDKDEDLPYYFEFRIQIDEITKDISIVVTDFAIDDEIDETKLLWESQISDLKKVIGSA